MGEGYAKVTSEDIIFIGRHSTCNQVNHRQWTDFMKYESWYLNKWDIILSFSLFVLNGMVCVGDKFFFESFSIARMGVWLSLQNVWVKWRGESRKNKNVNYCHWGDCWGELLSLRWITDILLNCWVIEGMIVGDRARHVDGLTELNYYVL